MIKPSDIVLSGLMIAAAVWTFQIKHEAELSSDKVAGLLRQIDREKDKIDLLEADWAVLTQPKHLQNMAGKFEGELRLQQLEVDQIITLDDLPPLRQPIDSDYDPIGALARGIASGDVITGSVGERKQ
jgi:hypothetical protein